MRSVSNSPRSLRHLFAVIIVFYAVSDATQLWQKYQHQLAQEIVISSKSTGGNILSRYGLTEPNINATQHNTKYSTETNYNSS